MIVLHCEYFCELVFELGEWEGVLRWDLTTPHASALLVSNSIKVLCIHVQYVDAVIRHPTRIDANAGFLGNRKKSRWLQI